jgi:hypothetical protein
MQMRGFIASLGALADSMSVFQFNHACALGSRRSDQQLKITIPNSAADLVGTSRGSAMPLTLEAFNSLKKRGKAWRLVRTYGAKLKQSGHSPSRCKRCY